MTVIVGYLDNGKATMVADRMEAFGDDCSYLLGLPKIRSHKDQFIIGAAGDSIGCNIVVHHTTPPKWSKSDTPISYFTKKLPAAWLAEMKSQNFNHVDDVEILVASPEHGLWVASGGGGVSTSVENFWAIGAGAKYALGAYAATTSDVDLDVIMAVSAYYCPFVSRECDQITI